VISRPAKKGERVVLFLINKNEASAAHRRFGARAIADA